MCCRTSQDTEVTVVSPSLLARLNGFVETRMGLHFPPTRLSDLERGIRAAAVEFGFNHVDSCIEWLLSSAPSPDRIKTLSHYLTVGDTYFFRDKGVFEILETRVLPEIIDSRRGREQNLRIWSAGCSTGEEPYSLAILLARILPDLQDWKTAILATDINSVSLAKAAAGVYREWSFRDTPRWVKEGYFKGTEQNLEIIPTIKRMVTFSCLNLAEDPYPAIINATNAMDIIFCRNVLMYFSRERAQRVIHKLAGCLVDGGWLVVSPVDVPGTEFPPILRPVRFPDAILFRKETRPQDPLLRPTPRLPGVIQEPKGATRKIPHSIRAKRPVPPTPAPAASDSLGNQARLLADQGRLTEALEVCVEDIRSDKLNPALHYLQATILQEMGRTDEAVDALQRAVYIDQDFAIAHFALGHMMPQGKEAGKHLEKAISLLEVYEPGEIPPEGERMSSGRLIELITAMQAIDGRR